MVTRARPAPAGPFRVYLRHPTADDARSFLEAARVSTRWHGSSVRAPATPTAFKSYLVRFARRHEEARHAGFLALRAGDDALVGVVNFSEIVRGAFRSAYVGYYGFAPYTRQGYMTEALALGLDEAFGPLALHRIEANVQPANLRSLALVERVGFTREGYSRRYLKVSGRWRDHVRYAMLAEDWKVLRPMLAGRLTALHASRGRA